MLNLLEILKFKTFKQYLLIFGFEQQINILVNIPNSSAITLSLVF